jgi:hypothetical protein
MKLTTDKLLAKNQKLIHSEMKKVISHVQRDADAWILNTVMIEDCDVPFRYKRKKLYKSLTGARVNMTYYTDTESIAGIDMDVMKVVKINRS